MPDTGKAVFLSYASQDAEAAQRICEALRAAGVEVWFDQNELVGGDAWDAKIRGQVKSCALFVPIISASTQARREGYFRLEWKLADDRTHLMAKGTPFLLPVVIDDTPDTGAIVPDSFLAVQWSRLPDGGRVEPFCARVRALIEDPNSSGRAGPSSAPITPIRAPQPPVSVRAVVRGKRWLFAGCACLAILTGVALWWPWSASRSTSAPSASSLTATSVKATALPPAKAPPLSPARVLVEKARALYEPWDLATKDDFVMAEQFLKRAVDLDPTDGEVWAAQTLVSCAFVGMSVTAEDRRAEMRMQAERAIKLAPDSDNARFARAYALRLEGKPGAWGEAEPILRAVVSRNPDNKMMLRGLGYPLAQRAGTRDEGLAVLRRAAALPGGDAVAEFNIGQIHMYGSASRDLKEALAAYNRSLKLAPLAHRTHSFKIELLFRYAGDLAAARQAVRDVPNDALREDRVVVFAVHVLLALGEPDEALRILSSTYPYLSMSVFTGPTPYLKGVAHRQANRLSAATTEWNVALKEIQRRLDANPTARNELLLKASTLAHLGRHAEAIEVLALYEQLVPPNSRNDQRVLIVKAQLGRVREVVAALDDQLSSGRALATTAAFILVDPELAPIRLDPGYAALAAKARAIYAEVQLE